MSQISRHPRALVEQLFRSHDYPDGVVLMLGTLFAPVVDRGTDGRGFTHRQGDLVRIAAPQLGSLVNEVQHCGDCPRWNYGIRALMANLGRRGLLG
jgi:fumarylacetoacetate (FAA) hydrolase family protein